MGQIIAARKPYYNEQFSDDFNWFVSVTVGATLISDYVIIKRSPTAGISQDLILNVSPFASNGFTHIPNTVLPTTIQEPTNDEQVNITLSTTLDPADIYATFNAYDGWEPYLNNVLGLSNPNIVKKLFYGSPQYITAKPFGTDNITWLMDDGNFINVNNLFEDTETNVIFPVIHPILFNQINDTDVAITLIGKDAGNQELWRVRYEFVCPYDDAHTIGFINKYGVWEFIDVSGRRKTKLKVDRENYTRYSNGIGTNYNVNGEYEYEFNTGWVDKGFEDVMEGLMLSETVILYTGTDYSNITIESKSLDIQDSRTDKMVNYKFNAKLANKIISIT